MSARKNTMGFTDAFLDDVCGRLVDYLKIVHGIDARERKPFLCPFHDDKSPSMYFYGDDGHPVCYCFGCHKKADILDFVERDYGLTGAEGVVKAAEIVRLDPEQGRDRSYRPDYKASRPAAGKPASAPLAQRKTAAQQDYDFTAQAEAAAAALWDYSTKEAEVIREESRGRGKKPSMTEIASAVAAGSGSKLTNGETAALIVWYLKSRGLTEDTIKSAKIGYSSSGFNQLLKDYPDSQTKSELQSLYKITFPFFEKGKCGYFVSEIIDRSYTDRAGKYRKPSLKGRQQPYYHESYLTDPEQTPSVLYVVEGIYDALSLEQCGRRALALVGTAHKRLIRLIEEHADTLKSTVAVIATDADDAGDKAAQEIAGELDRIGIMHVRGRADGGKDYSECLQYNSDKLLQQLDKLDSIAKEEAEKVKADEEEKKLTEELDYLKNSASYSLIGFCDTIREAPKHPPIPTGIRQLDSTLSGGLRSWLYIIGGMSSVGKTALMMQIADQIAAGGTDVLIVSLEMSKYELIARSISRETALLSAERTGDTCLAKTAVQILDGKVYSAPEDDQKLFDDAIGRYMDHSNNIYIREGMMDIGLGQISAMVYDHIRITGRRPVLIVDYLQIMAPWDVRATDKDNMDHAVSGLKRLARDAHIPVIAISSFNRAAYSAGAEMNAFKESGTIEYSSDVLMAIQLSGMDSTDDVRSLKGKAKTANEAGEAVKIQLKILKNRNGGKKDCELYYYQWFNLFTEDEEAVKSGRYNGWKKVT